MNYNPARIRYTRLSQPVDYFTIHTANGFKTLSRAKEIAAGFSRPIKLLGVTVLTNLDSASALDEIGIKHNMEEQIYFSYDNFFFRD